MILDIRKTDFIIKPDMVDFIAVIWGVAEVSWVEFSSESFTIHEGWHERENAITYPYLPQKQKEMFDRAINEVKYQHLFSGETYSYDGHLLNKGTGIKPIILKDPEESFVIGDKFFYEYTAYNSRGLVHLG